MKWNENKYKNRSPLICTIRDLVLELSPVFVLYVFCLRYRFFLEKNLYLSNVPAQSQE